MSDPRKIGLPYPFQYCDEEPFVNVDIGGGESVRVVTAGEYNAVTQYLRDQAQALAQDLDRVRLEYAALEAEHQRVTTAAYEQIKAAQTVIDVWNHYGHRHD